MELVYLWVEGYKNIKNQGFRFSPRFECEFDGENLTITENKDYVSIFPDNINITAIVGENGTGKSRLLCAILDNVNEHNISDDRIKPFIQCYFDKYNKKFIIESYSLLSNESQINCPDIDYELIQVSDTGIIKNFDFRDKMFFYHYKNDLAYPINDNKYGTYNEKIIKFTEPNKPNNKIDLEIEEEKNLKKLLFLIDSTKYSIDENKFFVPYKVWLQKENVRFLGKNRTNDSKYIELKNQFKPQNKIKELLLLENILFIKNLSEENSNEDLFQDITLPSFDINTINITQEIDTFRTNFLSINFQSKIDECRKNIKDNHNRDNYRESLVINECEKSLNLFKNIDTIISILYQKYNESIYYPNSELINNNDSNITLIMNLPRFLKIELIDSRTGVEYSELSTGEKSLLDVVYSIKNIIELRIKNNLSNSIFILLDEIESYLHPIWQKNLIQYIYNFVKIYSIDIHIILTSHSPFILSDIPKENVIFLEKYKKNDEEVRNENQKAGNCKNVSKDIELKTFGANIHTLLSDGFFMSDGLMGEFAKSKIEEIKKFYELVKKCEKIITKSENVKNTIKNIYQGYEPNFRNIQNIIGEKFLQTIIKNYLDELEILFNGKNKFLDNEIKRLQSLKDD
ncbi:AAA family ATPase [Aliarcobacter butzleri]|uniref:AAA family ATPase n=1 Tax=Aliarcobacter butzleri TaxID=28197 RepID=UPI003ADA73E0